MWAGQGGHAVWRGAGARSGLLTFVSSDGGVSRVVLSGRGVYRPGVAVSKRMLQGGARIDIAGLGFPAASRIAVGWESERPIVVETDGRTLRVTRRGG